MLYAHGLKVSQCNVVAMAIGLLRYHAYRAADAVDRWKEVEC